jgi:hypothetical protein
VVNRPRSGDKAIKMPKFVTATFPQESLRMCA